MHIETFTLALLFSSLIYLSMTVFVFWFFFSSPGARSFVGLMLALGIYSVGYYFELHSPDLAELFFWLKFEYIGIATYPVLFLIFVIQYTQRKKYLGWRAGLALFLIPLITISLVWTNDAHHLFYRSLSLVARNGLELMEMVPGPWYWVSVVYGNLAALIGAVILVRMWHLTRPPLNRQYAAMFVGSLIPWAGFFIYITGNSPLNLDLSPFGMIFTGLVYLYSLIRHRVFDTMPVASPIVMDKMRDGVVITDAENRVIDVNPAAVEFFGSRPEIIGRRFDALLSPKANPALNLSEVEEGRLEIEEETPSGGRWLDLVFSPLGSDGSLPGHVVIVRDITENKVSQAALESTNTELGRRIQELDEYGRELQKINDMTVELQACVNLEDAFQVIPRYLSDLLPTLAGGLYIYSPLRQTMDLACSWNDFAMLVEEFEVDDCLGLARNEVYRVGEFVPGQSCRHVDKGNGHHYACHPVIMDGTPFALLHYYHLGLELSESKLRLARIGADAIKMALSNLRMRENLRQETIRDPLTGLFNRRYMTETLDLELARAERSRRPLSLIMVDVDHYKSLNDQYGHSLGDKVLVQVSQLFENNIRRGDIACRYGGDEFVLVMPGVSLEVAIERAEHIRHQVMKMRVPVEGGGEETISLSMGVAAHPLHGHNAESLLRAADQALYQAKEAGRNRTFSAS